MAATTFSSGTMLFSLLAACLAVPAVAQASPGDGQLRLVSREEGEAIVQTAWELRRGLLPKPDCSHFVHAIYTRAGLDYEYASTADIFEGIDPFQRVKTSQPGDLVVWQGHMGIVVDPVEHSFYSSVVTGFAIEDYRSNYWLGRGAARFYRYLVDDGHAARLAVRTVVKPIVTTDPSTSLRISAGGSDVARTPQEPQLALLGPGLTRKDSLENLMIGSRTGVDDARSARPAPSSIVKQFIATTDPSTSHRISAGGSDDHPSKPKPGLPGTPTDATRTPQGLQPDLMRKDSFKDPRQDSRAGELPALTPGDAQVRDEVFVSQRKKPSKEEVLAAVLRSVDANGQRLLLNPRLDSEPAIALAEQFTVTRVEIKNNSGWAELKVKRTASILYGKADQHASTDIWQARLTRQGQDWILLVPQERTYIRTGAAFTVLVNHLAVVSRETASNQELKKFVRILDQLLTQTGDDITAGGSK